MVPSRAEGSTTAGIRAGPRKVALVARGVTTALLAGFVLAGLLGLLGDRSRVASAHDGPASLSVKFAPLARGGTNVPWQVELHDPRGLPPQVDLVLDARYFEIFEHQRFYPEPAAERRDGDNLVMTFDTGQATSLVVAHDSYVQPRYSFERLGSVALLTDGVPTLTVPFRTVVLP